jgi:hypothetical protein
LVSAHGTGYTLTAVDTSADPTTWSNASAWRASDYIGGTPDGSDVGIAAPPGAILINEVLANSSQSGGTRIELNNTTGAAIDLSGWYLSDDAANLQKYRLPSMAPLGAGEYLVLDEDSTFGAAFSLSPQGGNLVLQAADQDG